ncbi:MAG: hypothetical protein MJZ84_02670 [Paludibacteraceae bacterium]|nr:hypothetical protein [Paludibacteraceae bacterium]
MKKMMYFAAALLVLVGCQKKDNSIENTPDNYGTITGKIELPKTPNKIAAPEGWESATDPFTMVWEEGDKIYLGGNELEMTALDEASGIATFGGVLLDEMSNYGVSYGYDNTSALYFPLVAKYVEGNYRPFARGGGHNSEFTINEFGPVIGLQLKGTDVLTRIEVTVGEGNVVTMPDYGESLDLQLTSEVQKVYVPYFFIGEDDIQPADMTITFYVADDMEGEVAIMSKTIAQANLPENGKVTTYPTLEVKAAPTYEAVDLGLSVKWATMNVGATTPEDYGDYFAWGETSPKEVYEWIPYFDLDEDSEETDFFTKYYNDGGKTTLDLEDDAAHVNWGGSWRMPTKAEFEELKTSCEWVWQEDYNNTGVNGYLVKSKAEGNTNSIFLPAAGYYDDWSHCVGDNGYYWSSSLDEEWSDEAYCRFLSSGVVSWVTTGSRYLGHSVRPVCPIN